MKQIGRSIFISSLPLWLSACAIIKTPPATVPSAAPAAWQAPLPGEASLAHAGTLSGLSDWWAQFRDPLLVELIDTAQNVSPSVSAASTRIAQANAARVAAGAALKPELDGNVSAVRRSAFPPLPGGNIYQGALQSTWEMDLFGANARARDAAQQRLNGAQAGWHQARVSVAAEVASQYMALRACEKLLAITQKDASSRAETARLTALLAEAGFQAPANAALSRASAAEGSSRASQKKAQCDSDIKALVMLTGMAEPALRDKLRAGTAALPQSATLAINSLPAATLAQRPDIFAAAREVAAASQDVGSTEAQRYPRLSLSGSIGAARFQGSGVSLDLTTWSIGPLALSLPIYDAGKRAANIKAARARYDEAATKYRASVRLAVREVEDALVTLASTAARNNDARIAVEGFFTAFEATRSRFKSGMVSVFELEEARRNQLAAETALVSLESDRLAAWITLYRAAGGGWSQPVQQ